MTGKRYDTIRSTGAAHSNRADDITGSTSGIGWSRDPGETMSGDNQYDRRAIMQYYEIIFKRGKSAFVSMENYRNAPNILTFIAMCQNVALFHRVKHPLICGRRCGTHITSSFRDTNITN